MEKSTECTATPEKHAQHICELKKRGEHDKIAAARENPKFYCLYCASRVNSSDSVCHPMMI